MYRKFLKSTWPLVLAIVLTPGVAEACRAVPSFDEIFSATAIVRATPLRYVSEPKDTSILTFGVPETQVIFRVDEILTGKLKGVKDTFTLNAYLSDTDDFNDGEVPYLFGRPGGRNGSCFANTYRKGAQFLLFIKETKEGLTTNISALGPTNEQLRGPDDAWLRWVREEIVRRRNKN